MITYVLLLLFCHRLYCTAIVLAQNTNQEISSSCQTPQNKIGQCIPIRLCPVLRNLVEQQPISQQNVNFLRQAHCGFEGTQPKVCCALEGDHKEATGAIKNNILPDIHTCGLSKGSRIVGGELTALNEYPWMALLEYDTPTGRGFRCGGSLINNRYILTAAHCVNKIPKSWTLISVRLGEYDLDTEEDCEGDVPGLEDCSDKPLDIGIEKKIVYEQYDPATVSQHNDIALLRLEKDVTFSEWVKPICLPTSTEFQTRNFAGTNLTVSGWGRTETSSQSNIKLKVQVPVKSDSDCLEVYSTRANIRLIDNQLCAGGAKGKDSCTGDSGGPLMTLNRTPTEDNWYAIGVVSFGPTNCGLKNWPGVYTKVAPYVSWIQSNLEP